MISLSSLPCSLASSSSGEFDNREGVESDCSPQTGEPLLENSEEESVKNLPENPYEGYTGWKYTKLTVSLLYHELWCSGDNILSKSLSLVGVERQLKHPWYSKITIPNDLIEAHLYLGALPIERKLLGISFRNDLEELVNKLGIGAILSLVEMFEVNCKGWVTSPISNDAFKTNNVERKILPTPDFETVSLPTLEEGADFIHEQRLLGKNVYVHCKAGVGRSALQCICYLIKKYDYTSDNAYDCVIKDRQFIRIDPDKKQSTTEFEKSIKQT